MIETDKVYMNKSLVEDDIEDILVLSADHIYSMDYNKFYKDHKNKGADLSIAHVDVPIEEAIVSVFLILMKMELLKVLKKNMKILKLTMLQWEFISLKNNFYLMF